MNSNPIERIRSLWGSIYGNAHQEKLESFLEYLGREKHQLMAPSLDPGWYKDAIVYSLYVDLFNKDFRGLEERLDYLSGLGVSCLWLLPILKSPMRDAGFDISDYRRVRPELLSLPEDSTADEQDEVFRSFIDSAHDKGIKVIFDIAINHTSDEHFWFRESRKSPLNPYRDFYIWNKDDRKYKEARIIFYGIEESNWKKDGDEYYFHRFFDFQPDLNYRNPQVLIEMSGNMVFWLKRGIDGFRADAIPYLWKEEGTACENEPTTHLLVKFFRAVLDYMRPHTLLLAEACQKPMEVVRYFGDGDECNAGYHFPLMPQMFKALAAESSKPVRETLSTSVTPEIPEGVQWFTFLRCHDELSLELVYVTEEDRRYIHESYCKKPEWDFRKGQGISARLSELMDRDPSKIALIYSIMLTLPGTPVIYYGDEFGKLNDEGYYKEMIQKTGKDDTRFLVRGKIDWQKLEKKLKDEESFESRVFDSLSNLLNTRKEHDSFGKGSINWLEAIDGEGNPLDEVLIFEREYKDEKLLIINNLSGKPITMKWPCGPDIPGADLLGQPIREAGGNVSLEGRGFRWIDLS